MKQTGQMVKSAHWARPRTQRFGLTVTPAWIPVFVLVYNCLVSQWAAAGDSTYQCTPSGFTIGIPPIHTAHDVATGVDARPLNLEELQDRLGEILSKSGLFSNVVTIPDMPRPDSTDLSLLVSIPWLRQIVPGGEPVYGMGVSVLLVENLTGRTIFQKTYSEQFRARPSGPLPIGLRSAGAVGAAFPSIAVKIVRDLDPILNRYANPAMSELKRDRTVTHSSLEPLYILPTIVAGPMAGLGNYSLYIGENLRERLDRKNCFQIVALPDSSAQCAQDSLARQHDASFASLAPCVADTARQWLLLVNWVSALGDSLLLRSVLLQTPEMQILYDRSLATITGWRLGNALEQQAAGMAQAAHAHRH